VRAKFIFRIGLCQLSLQAVLFAAPAGDMPAIEGLLGYRQRVIKAFRRIRTLLRLAACG
jgi:hypothetical protein